MDGGIVHAKARKNDTPKPVASPKFGSRNERRHVGASRLTPTRRGAMARAVTRGVACPCATCLLTSACLAGRVSRGVGSVPPDGGSSTVPTASSTRPTRRGTPCTLAGVAACTGRVSGTATVTPCSPRRACRGSPRRPAVSGHGPGSPAGRASVGRRGPSRTPSRTTARLRVPATSTRRVSGHGLCHAGRGLVPSALPRTISSY